jgi:Glycosyltransferase 61
MQQLYRCWSWWNANSDKIPVLIFQHGKKSGRNKFLLDFFSVLEKEINLQIVKSHDGPFVQAKDTGMWDNDIELTDFAMFDPENNLRKVFANHIPDVLPDIPCRKNMNRLPKIAILNRATNSRRHLLNANELASSIETTFPGQNVPIVFFENKTLLEQAKFFMETDIVISPHGAQLTGIAFMKNCSSVIEFFPKNYLTADYFGSLAAAVGVDHRYFYLSDDKNRIQSYEKYHYIPDKRSRDKDQCPQLGLVVPAVVDVIKNWRPCCSTYLLSSGKITSRDGKGNKQPLGTDFSKTNSASINPIIDIIAIGSLSRSILLDTQQQTFGSHRYVRNLYPITELNDTETKCVPDLSANQMQDVIKFCSNGNMKGQSDMSKQFRTDLFRPVSNSTEWLCAQKRTIDGLHIALEKYKNGITPIPDYLILIKDDTYLNIDSLVETFQESYPPNENHIIAGCTYLRPKKVHFVIPIGGVGSVLTRATIEMIMKPIHCQGVGHYMDPYTRWACWRLKYNHVGEWQFFKDGMSIGDLMYAYTSGLLYTKVVEWKDTGFCFHSDHALAYFFNFYHVSVPDWILNETNPTDNIRKLYSYKKLSGSSEDGHTGKGGECDSIGNKCTDKSRICHSLNLEHMMKIHNQQQSSI